MIKLFGQIKPALEAVHGAKYLALLAAPSDEGMQDWAIPGDKKDYVICGLIKADNPKGTYFSVKPISKSDFHPETPIINLPGFSFKKKYDFIVAIADNERRAVLIFDETNTNKVYLNKSNLIHEEVKSPEHFKDFDFGDLSASEDTSFFAGAQKIANILSIKLITN